MMLQVPVNAYRGIHNIWTCEKHIHFLSTSVYVYIEIEWT